MDRPESHRPSSDKTRCGVASLREKIPDYFESGLFLPDDPAIRMTPGDRGEGVMNSGKGHLGGRRVRSGLAGVALFLLCGPPAADAAPVDASECPVGARDELAKGAVPGASWGERAGVRARPTSFCASIRRITLGGVKARSFRRTLGGSSLPEGVSAAATGPFRRGSR